MSDFKLNLQRGLLTGLLLCGTPAFAQDSLRAKEAAERSADALNASALLEEGDLAYLKSDFKTAVSKYGEALSKLKEGAPAARKLRASILQRFSQASLVRAQELMRKGDASGATALLDEVEAADPDNQQVARFRAKIDDPIRNNPSLTPEHTAKVDKVRRLLYEAEGYYDLAKFDHATMTYEDVLRIDKYNKAARRGMERVSVAKSEYARAARDQARAELLKDVGAEWELKVDGNADVPAVGVRAGLFDEQLSPSTGIETKLNTIILPEVVLNDATLSESLDYLRVISRELDRNTLDEANKGVDFVVQLGDEAEPAVQEIRASRLNLKLRNVPLREVLRLITEGTGTTFRVDDFAVVLNAAGFSDPTLVRRVFRVPPGFLRSGPSAAVGLDADPFANGAAAEGGLVAKSLTATEKLKSVGVSFPEGATARFNAVTSTLTVRNTAANMRLIEAIVADAALTEPVLVSVKTTIVDISQDNLEEIGFDTVLGEFNVGGRGILSGGTVGNGGAITDTITGRPVTAGLRSGELASDSSLDALLTAVPTAGATGAFTTGATGVTTGTVNLPAPADTTSPRASGTISVRGLIDGTAHEILMRGLSQKTGADIMTRPEVITLPGQNASVESIMEFFYPDSFDPPELPNQVGAGNAAVTPATPTDFVQRNLGMSLEVLPQVGPNRQIIEVSVNPIVTDFEGFINYGTPIVGSNSTTTFDLVGGTATTSGAFGELTPNAILKPLFRTIQGKTSLQILDGQTIVMGGQLTEVRQQINDKVPILGDLPLVGRIFRNDSISVEKRSILIFVTVDLMDPAGNLYRNR